MTHKVEDTHIHAGNTYRLYDKNGATRCEYHSCPYNIYDAQIGDYPDENYYIDNNMGKKCP
jgi:hypothetical protein